MEPFISISANEVRSFLLGSAKYWLEEFHADGIASRSLVMLYLTTGANASGFEHPRGNETRGFLSRNK